MKHILIACIICFFFCKANGQTIDTSLKFNQRFTKCERKWVVLTKSDTAKEYLFGFIYVDSQAGFTFDMKGSFRLDAANHYLVDTSISVKQSLKYRIAPTWRDVALLPASRIKEMHIPKQPAWIKFYYNYTDTVQHNFRWGFIYNDFNECDTALIYLLKAYKVMPHYKGLEFELIFAYNSLAQYDNAVNIITSALQNDPENVLFYRELGYAYLHKKMYQRSIDYFNHGINMCSDKQMESKSEMAINMAIDYKLEGNETEYQEWGKKAKLWAPLNSAVYNLIISKGF